MRQKAFRLLCCAALSLALAGCGGSKGSSEQPVKAQGQSGGNPIDTELQQHMKMYKEIKQQEFNTQNQIRQSEKEHLKKLESQQEQTLRRELQYQEKIRTGQTFWKKENKNQEQQQKKK